jgi:hypothetical protein
MDDSWLQIPRLLQEMFEQVDEIEARLKQALQLLDKTEQEKLDIMNKTDLLQVLLERVQVLGLGESLNHMLK